MVNNMLRSLVCLALFLVVAPLTAQAEPILQLYVEGATYDATTESWVSTGPSFTLWVIGNTGWNGTIHDVRMSVAYDESETVNLSFTPSTTGNLGNFTDPSTPAAPTYLQTVTDGSAPLLGDGSSLPPHGIFNQPGVDWHEFALGDFTLTDSPLADFINAFPANPTKLNQAQINVYDVEITGTASLVQFDVYDHVAGRNNVYYKFAPFSHNAETGDTPVPEPGSVLLCAVGLAGWAAVRRRRRRA